MTYLNSVKQYFSGVISEVKKVAWPTRKQVTENTIIVISAVVAAMIIFGLIDFGLSKLLEYVIQTQG